MKKSIVRRILTVILGAALAFQTAGPGQVTAMAAETWQTVSQNNTAAAAATAGQTLTGLIGLNVTVAGKSGQAVGIGLYNTNGRDYLFLPSGADQKALIFNYSNDKYTVSLVKDSKNSAVAPGSTVSIVPYLGTAEADGSRPLTVRLTDAAGSVSDHQLYVMQSSGIASVYISSGDPAKGREYVEADKSNKTSGSMVMFSSTGQTVYAGALSQIKGRGNSTFTAQKKPYQIKLETKTDLIQTGNSSAAAKTWVLLANAYDPTLVHNTAALKMAKAMGIDAPDCRPVDLYYDGVYRGNYLLTEKIEVGSGRVEITDLEEKNEKANGGKDISKNQTATGKNKYGDTVQYVTGVTNPEVISGGYLLELDNAYYKSERSYFVLSNGAPFVVKCPENCSKEEIEYISDYMEEMLQAASNGGTNPTNGKSVWEYIDKTSLTKYFILQEAVKNADAFASSSYLYMDNNGNPMTAGPAWDFDDSFGIRNDVAPVEGIVAGSAWINAFMNLPDFRTSVKNYYTSTGYSKITGVGISKIISEVAASEKMDRIVWNGKDQIYQELGSYADDTAYFKNYAAARAKWLKSEFAAW